MSGDRCVSCRWHRVVEDQNHGARRMFCASPQAVAAFGGMTRCAFERDGFPEPWRGEAGRKCGREALNYEEAGDDDDA